MVIAPFSYGKHSLPKRSTGLTNERGGTSKTLKINHIKMSKALEDPS
jgi:hypothetical protein